MTPTTLDISKPAIVAASTARDILTVAENDPALKAAFMSAFGPQIEAAQKNPLVSLGAGAIVSSASYFGLSIDGPTSLVLATVVAILAGDLSQWVSGRRKVVTP